MGMTPKKDTGKVTLGSGNLFLNGVDVGHLKGDVEFTYTAERVEFKPANMLNVVKVFKVGEDARLKASVAELKIANIKLAMGVTTTVGASQSFPSHVGGSSCSYPLGEPVHSISYDVLTFGGSKAVAEMCLHFIHTRPDGKTFHILFYKSTSLSELTLPFHETEITLHDMTFKGLADAGRAEGDQVGFFAEQVDQPA